MTPPASFKRLLARDDRHERAAHAAHVRVRPERVFMAWTTKLLVPVALDRPADKMAVFVVIVASGQNRASAVAFSLS